MGNLAKGSPLIKKLIFFVSYLTRAEFHHAVNEQYQRIVDYFKPKFLLGLTATPERMDGKISMKSAITMCHMRFH